MKASSRRSSMINMDTSLSTFSESFYRLFNNLNEDAEESLVSLLEEKVIPKDEKEEKPFKESYKRPKTLMVDRQYETRRSFHRKRKDDSGDQFLKTYEYYESLHSPAVARRRSSSIAVPQPTVDVSNFLCADKPPRSVSPRPTSGRKCALTTATPQRNRTASMPTVSRQKFEKMAVVSTFSKVLKLFVVFAQFVRLSKFHHIIQKLFTIDHCLHENLILDANKWLTVTNKELKVFSSASVSSVLLVLITFSYMEYGSAESITNKILILVNDLTIMTVFTIEIQLYGLCEMIRIRLGLLNDSLKRSMVCVGDGIAATEIGTKLKGTFVIYWKVVDLLELVVRTYRLQIFGGLCLTFLHLLIDVYLTMYSITESKDSGWMEALNAKPLCHFFRLTLVSMAGYGIRKQVSKTREILTLNEVAGFEDKSIRNEVSVFMMRLNRRNVGIPIYCVMHLDLPLIISVIGFVSMFIIYSEMPMLSQIRRQDDPDGYYRLRSFSITPNGVCKNLGDCLKTRRSRSSCSVDSSPAPSSHRLTVTNSQESNNEVPVFTVGMLGASNVGKTTLSYQFTTSEYICAYDTSLDDEFGQKTVCISLNGQEAEFNIIDIPASEMSVETFCYTFNVDVFVVVYSIVDMQSFKTAEDILLYLWKNDYMSSKGVILVGNKADLERRREIPVSTGRKLALSLRCKFIETSSGLDHNVDELLVGIFAQVQLNPKRNRMQQRGAVENGKQLFKQILKFGKKAKSCENLFVL